MRALPEGGTEVRITLPLASAPARRRSPSMRTLRVLIADDEPLIRLGIRRALEAMPDVEVAGECGAVADAVGVDRAGSRPISSSSTCRCRAAPASTWCARSAPSRMPPVIFVTAFDAYAVQAFEVNAVDYVLKPFDPERLQAAVERARGTRRR